MTASAQAYSPPCSATCLSPPLSWPHNNLHVGLNPSNCFFLCVLSGQIAHLRRPHTSTSLGAAMASWSQPPGTAQRCSEALPCPWLPCHGTGEIFTFKGPWGPHSPSPQESLSAEHPLSSSPPIYYRPMSLDDCNGGRPASTLALLSHRL